MTFNTGAESDIARCAEINRQLDDLVGRMRVATTEFTRRSAEFRRRTDHVRNLQSRSGPLKIAIAECCTRTDAAIAACKAAADSDREVAIRHLDDAKAARDEWNAKLATWDQLDIEVQAAIAAAEEQRASCDQQEVTCDSLQAEYARLQTEFHRADERARGILERLRVAARDHNAKGPS